MSRFDTRSGIEIRIGQIRLQGDLTVPRPASGVVLFAHGSGSSRHSPRNRHVARHLQQAGLATLLMDLLTLEEEATDALTAHLRFDIRLLADRLTQSADWVASQPDLRDLRLGLFGASTGAAAALVSAAERTKLVRAVVSRGGRPDLASPALPTVQAPTLLIVGGNDGPVIAMNREAMQELCCEMRLEIIPGASHLFEEPGALDKVAQLACQWFLQYLAP
ncbi:MAG: dienelactone hydrolase family protein [Verrucomicrobia bacterium]|nr:dienelactone hydrolase family protein [Verrucomicrobiota bacterium]